MVPISSASSTWLRPSLPSLVLNRSTLRQLITRRIEAKVFKKEPYYYNNLMPNLKLAMLTRLGWGQPLAAPSPWFFTEAEALMWDSLRSRSPGGHWVFTVKLQALNRVLILIYQPRKSTCWWNLKANLTTTFQRLIWIKCLKRVLPWDLNWDWKRKSQLQLICRSRATKVLTTRASHPSHQTFLLTTKKLSSWRLKSRQFQVHHPSKT